MDVETIKSHVSDHKSLLTGLGIDESYLKNKHGPCPVCSGTDRFRFDDRGYGSFYCNNCGSGDFLKLLMLYHGWSFVDTLNEVSNYLGLKDYGNRARPTTKRKKLWVPNNGPREWARKQLREVFKGCVEATPEKAAPLYRYLNNRGLDFKQLPDSIKYHPNLEYFEPDDKTGKPKLLGSFPAMIGVFSNSINQPITLHRTYLTEDGQKAPVPSPKKIMPAVLKGGVNGCSIKLGMPSDTLHLAEGIETSLAIMQALNVPVWGCGSTVFLERVQIPQTVSQVYIMGDLDASEAGEKSANILAQRLRKNGIKTAICLPDEDLLKPGGKSVDWLDVFQGNEDNE